MSVEDILIRRQVFLQRFATGQVNQAQALLESLYKTIEQRIIRASTDFELLRLTQVREDVSILLARGFEDIRQQIIDGTLEYSEAEMLFTQSALQQGTTPFLATPSMSQLEQAVLLKGMDVPVGASRLTLNEAIDQFSKKKSADVHRIINEGILLGDTSKDIAKNISTTLGKVHKNQLDTLVRTATNHAASAARRTVFNENSDILKGEEWVSTLDSRTSLICAGRDGRIYPVGRGAYPPAHWNCRSIRIPIVKDEYSSGLKATKRPNVGADGAGTVGGKTKFDGWLRSQPADFQDEYFSQFPDGLEKAKLFRQGGLKIDRFRNEVGKDYSLEQLQALEPVAFDKANLNI